MDIKSINNTSLVDAFDACEKLTVVSCARGSNKQVIRDKGRKYSYVGPSARRAGTGIWDYHNVLLGLSHAHQLVIVRYFRSVEYLFLFVYSLSLTGPCCHPARRVCKILIISLQQL